MNITVHDTGAQGFNALLYATPSRALIDYIGENVSAAMAATNRFSQSFLNTVGNIFQTHGSEASVNESKLLLNRMGSSFRDDIIYSVPLEQLGSANLLMQHYIMANPYIGNLDKKGMCHGFADTYINLEPNTYGENTMLYQNVMDGVHDMDKDKLLFYHHTEMPDDGLSVYDKINVLDTWDNVIAAALSGIDPTDPNRGAL